MAVSNIENNWIASKDHSHKFRSLMLVYEMLYMKLEHLIHPDMQDGIWVSKPVAQQAVYFERLETHRYMTVEHLSYQLQSDQNVLTPDAVLRRYHDVKTAELISCVPDQAISDYCHPGTEAKEALQARWQMNRFLLKWCDFLLDKGHNQNSFTRIE